MICNIEECKRYYCDDCTKQKKYFKIDLKGYYNSEYKCTKCNFPLTSINKTNKCVCLFCCGKYRMRSGKYEGNIMAWIVIFDWDYCEFILENSRMYYLGLLVENVKKLMIDRPNNMNDIEPIITNTTSKHNV